MDEPVQDVPLKGWKVIGYFLSLTNGEGIAAVGENNW